MTLPPCPVHFEFCDYGERCCPEPCPDCTVNNEDGTPCEACCPRCACVTEE